MRPSHLLSLVSLVPLSSCIIIALTPWEQIHQALHTYPLAIDSKDFGLLSAVFTPNAFANYTGALSNMTGLAAIQAGLAASVVSVDSQHLLGTTTIQIDNNGTVANSTTYFQASLFGKPYSVGEVLYLYGYYQDQLVQVGNGWRIDNRLLVFQGPGMVGNLSVLGG